MQEQMLLERLSVNQNVGRVKESFKIECKTDVPSNNAQDVLGATAICLLKDKQIENGKIKCEGKAIFYFFYLSDGEVKKVEKATEFYQELSSDLIADGVDAEVNFCVDKTQVEENGINLTLTAVVTATAQLEKEVEITPFVGTNNYVTDSKEFEVVKGYEKSKTTYTVNEEFELPYTIKDVLCQNATPTITAVQCGVGAIIVDGEIMVNAMLLQNVENSDIIKESKTIPFRVELDYEQCMPVMQAIARVGVKSFTTDVSVEEDGQKSVVNLSIVLSFTARAYSTERINLITDAYSLSKEVEVVSQRTEYVQPVCSHCFREKISGRAKVEPIPAGARLTAVGDETIEIVSFNVENQELEIDGLFSFTCYVKDGEGKTYPVKSQIPFNVKKQGVGEVKITEIRACQTDTAVRIVSLEEVELSTELCFTAYAYKISQLNCVVAVNEICDKECENCAISVYIPVEGEELWALAKRLNVSPETLVQTNKELQFPLTGKERIVVYRQK